MTAEIQQEHATGNFQLAPNELESMMSQLSDIFLPERATGEAVDFTLDSIMADVGSSDSAGESRPALGQQQTSLPVAFTSGFSFPGLRFSMPQSAPTQANDGGAPSAAAARAGKAAIKDAPVTPTTNKKKTVKTLADGGQATTPSPSDSGKAPKRSAGRPTEPALPEVVKMLADFKGASSTHPRFFGQERYTQTKAVGRLVDRVKGEMDKVEDPLEEDKFKKAKKSLEILLTLMKGYTQSKGAGFLKAYQEAESWAAMEPAVDLDFVPRWMSSEKSRSQLAAAKPKDFWWELSKDNMLRIGFEEKDLDAEWVGIISDKVVDICRSDSLENLPRALGEP
ncbi:unnamed protein product, partial [Prorocentrum cordatum]